MFDLNLLPVFEMMLLERNVTTAAEKMGLTQSAISNALGRLRLHFEDPLFVKTRQGMMPTPRALELAQPIQDALVLVRSTAEKNKGFDPLVSSRTFRLWMSDVGEAIFLPALMKHLRTINAAIQIETKQFDAGEVGDALMSGEIDFALGYLPGLGASVDKLDLFKEYYVCVSGQSDSKQRSLSVDAYLEAPHVLISSTRSGHHIVERSLEAVGYKRRVALRVPHYLVVSTVIDGTDLLVTVPSRVAKMINSQASVSVWPLPIEIPEFDVSMYWHPRFINDPALTWMKNLLGHLFYDPKQFKPKARRVKKSAT